MSPVSRAIRTGLVLVTAIGAGACSTTGPGPGATQPAVTSTANPGPIPIGQPPAHSSTDAPVRPRAGNPPFYKVRGRRYYVLDSAEGYHERGVASWYGPKFHGRPTANGETFDMHQLTAAHKSLPLPAYAEVTNLRTGDSVIVRINDRGPFIDNRLIDLSFAAAEKLDLIQAGTGLVDVRVLPDSVGAAPEPAGEISVAQADPGLPSDSQAPSTAQQIYLQVGAFGDPLNANRMQRRLRMLGFEGVVVHDDERIFRVRLGPIEDVANYDLIVERLRDVEIQDTYLTVQ